MAAIYVLGADGKYHAPGLPDVLPGGTVDPEPPGGLRWYGTTLFGQSFARYKPQAFGSESARYDQVETDTYATISGTVRRGSAVTRVYGGNSGAGTWTDAKPGYMRDGQPVVYSFKHPAAVSESAAKTDIRGFMDSKPTDERAWLCYWHEPDDNIRQGSLSWTQWLNVNVWIREVLEDEYEDRIGDGGDVRFGMITTGVPWNKGTQPGAAHGFQTYYNNGEDAWGGPGLWDFMGGDRYNPGWDGNTRYLTYPNWILRKRQMFEEFGLPFVVGEGGTARATITNGLSLAGRDAERAQWIRGLYDTIIEAGFFDAYCWWRVPSLSNSTNGFSTIMITPSGYNSTAMCDNGGYDAQAVVDVHSEYALGSMQAATITIPYHT